MARKTVGKPNICMYLFNIATAVFHQIRLQYKFVASKVVRKKLLNFNDIKFASYFKDEVIKIKEYKEEIVNHSRLQLGLETVFQLTGNAILLLYANTSTRSKQGLTSLFSGDANVLLGISFPPEIVIGILLAINLFGFIKVNMDGIVYGYASNYSIEGKAVVLLGIICANLVRIASIVLYFATNIGLFNLLHHYQGNVSNDR